MKKQSGLLRRSIILALLLLCILAALTVVSFAADIVDSGYCGGEGDRTNLTRKPMFTPLYMKTAD